MSHISPVAALCGSFNRCRLAPAGGSDRPLRKESSLDGAVTGAGAITGAVGGSGLGAVAGALASLLRENPNAKRVLKDILIGAGSGALVGGTAGGYGASKLNETAKAKLSELTSTTPKQVTAPKPKKKRMDLGTAALVGPTLGIGAAVHGHKEGGKDQAIRSGMISAGGGITGSMLASILTKGKRPGLAALGALAGSTAGSVGAASEFNAQQDKKASMLDGAKKTLASAGSKVHEAGTNAMGKAHSAGTGIVSRLGMDPNSTGGQAAMGGMGGAALGGIAGLLRALFDKEDDGVMSTLGKTISGAGMGGVAGAGIGGGLNEFRKWRDQRTLGARPQ